MKAIDINTTLIDGYLQLLNNLSPNNKLDLISKLTQTVKTDIGERKNSFYKSFGLGSQTKPQKKLLLKFVAVGLPTVNQMLPKPPHQTKNLQLHNFI